MEIARNEYGNNLVIGFDNSLVRGYTEVWDNNLNKYIKKGKWYNRHKSEPIMYLPDLDHSDGDITDTEILNFINRFNDIKWVDEPIKIDIIKI